MKRKPLGLFSDRVHTIPRRWSNEQLQKYATLFDGDVANISAWKDEDKEGNHYRDYFSNASSYTLTNYKAEARGFQGQEGEIFLDLERDLPHELEGRFDTVFNHTTLEHVLDVQKAFENLCLMSRESVIVVVPFLQQYHAPYGDYWRFTPLLIQKLFERHGLQLCYLDFNNHSNTSVYIFAIASREPERYAETFGYSFSVVDPAGHGDEPFIGCRAVPNRLHRAKRMVESWIKSPLRRAA